MTETTGWPRRVEGLWGWAFNPNPDDAGDWPVYALASARQTEAIKYGRIVCGTTGCKAELICHMRPMGDNSGSLGPFLGGLSIAIIDPCEGGECLRPSASSGVQMPDRSIQTVEAPLLAQDSEGVG